MYSAYDLSGRRTSARFASAAGQGIVYGYDTSGRLTSETNTIGTSRALSYQYDSASNRTRVTWPDAYFAQYIYDAMNRVDLVRENATTTLANYDYDTRGRRDFLTRGNGATSDWSYDAASRLTGLAHDLPGGTADDQTFGFGYTAASQMSQRVTANDNYNWLAANVSRSYNRNGLNQYTAISGTTHTYDARGNLTNDGARALVYDLENRLTSVTGGASATLNYDPLGRLRTYATGERALGWIGAYRDEARPQLVCGRDEGALFLTSTGQAIKPKKLTARVGAYVAAAGLSKSGSCHLFRHTAATLMLENGADIRFIQAMLGHESLDTTQIYTNVAIGKLAAVHAATHPGAMTRRANLVNELNGESDADDDLD